MYYELRTYTIKPTKLADWLAASEHASDIVAIRGAHRRHGGQGAIYVVLRKRR